MTFEVFQSDIREGLPNLGDCSVDFVITDPPYPWEYIELWKTLGVLSSRVLKLGGSLIAMCGQYYLQDIMDRLRGSIDYHWLITMVEDGGTQPSHFQKKVIQRHKVIVWYVKGVYGGPWVTDLIHEKWNKPKKGEQPEKTHKWQQSLQASIEIINRYTQEGSTVLDPFCGHGTFGVACVKLRRNYIGCDIDPECVNFTINRLKKTVPLKVMKVNKLLDYGKGERVNE